MLLTRRQFCVTTGLVAAGAALLPKGLSFLGFNRSAQAQTPTAADLMAPGALPDMALGNKNAPVTIIEYASMTCGHCATFSTRTFPELKKRYIDTGKVYFIFREFPLDPLAAAGFMLARCAVKDAGDQASERYFAMIETLFHEQAKWVTQKPIPPLFELAKQAGFTKETFEACLSDQALLDKLEKVRGQAAEKYGVNSTPSFFINGKVVRGDVSIDEMAKQIDPLLKS